MPTKYLLAILLFAALQANAAAKQITIEMYPPNDTSKTNPVTISFNAEIYPDGWWFSKISSSKFQLNSEEEFIIKTIKTNETGSKDELMSLFDSGSYSAVEELVSDPEVFKRNQNFFKSLDDSAFLAKVSYGKYTIYFIQHNYLGSKYFINHFPVIQKNGKFLLAPKDLEDDPIYLYFLNKYDDELETAKLKTIPTK